MNEKYLPKKVRVLLVDQLGNEKIVTIDAKWDRIRVNLQSGAKVESIPTATRAHIPSNLANRGLKVDINKGTFAADTVDVAKVEADRKFNEQVQKGINEFYAESIAESMKELGETTEIIIETDEFGNVIETNEPTAEKETDTQDKKETTVEETKAEETKSEETTKEEETTTEETTKEETTTTEETTKEETTTDIAPTEATTEKGSTEEPTVAGFNLSEGDAEPEVDSGEVDEDGNKIVGSKGDGEVANSSETTKDETAKDEATVTTSTNSSADFDSAIEEPFKVETVYEQTTIEKVPSNELVEDPGLRGNVAAKALGDDSVVVIPQLKPIQLKTFGSGNNKAGLDMDGGSGGLFGAPGPGSHTGHGSNINYHASGEQYVTDLSRYTVVDKTWSNAYVVEQESDIRDYANSSSNDYLLVLGTSFTINDDVDFKKKNFYLCANGNTLTFGFEEDTKNNNVKVGRIQHCRNIIVTNCQNTGGISGLNATGTDTSTHVPYDRKASVSYINQSGTVAYKKVSATAIQGGENGAEVVSVTNVKVEDIFSNVHDKIQFTGYDDDAAAFIRSTASYVFMGNVTAQRLVGAQGGLMKVGDAELLHVRGCEFYENKAFKGACFNVRFKTDTAAVVSGGATGTNKGVFIYDNKFERNGYAFFDRDDENPYTFGRYPFAMTQYYKVDGTGLLKEKITSGFNETTNTNVGYNKANGSKPKTSGTYETHQYQNLGYEKTTYNYDKTEANGLVLIDNVGIGQTNNTAISIEDNSIKNNMPYDLCGSFHVSLSNSLASSVPGRSGKDAINIDVVRNVIENNCQYKSSKNEGDVASGLTISMNPDGYVDHRTVRYEEAYKMGSNSEAIPYQKAIYENGEFGVAGRLDFFNNWVYDNYNMSPNPAGVSIRNIKEVQNIKKFKCKCRCIKTQLHFWWWCSL